MNVQPVTEKLVIGLASKDGVQGKPPCDKVTTKRSASANGADTYGSLSVLPLHFLFLSTFGE